MHPLLLSQLACCKMNIHFALHILLGMNQTVDIHLPICTPCMHVDFRKVYMCATVCACIRKSCIADFEPHSTGIYAHLYVVSTALAMVYVRHASYLQT